MALSGVDDGGDEHPEQVVDAEEVRGSIEEQSREGFVALAHVDHFNLIYYEYYTAIDQPNTG